ncbi:uncharacterized protein CTRU02_210573 [Colletotrichum truncatum]|uniref:Uncharacterized protein n=1 Tax=Colletotrichum truncatum TaxID=5467 RepID=A0ACC3YPD8_COLTU|nr:uncharacterized protein CTRU02_12776 [Colletotrichum truncatum]KAF6784247.1 hypothetical protein CTRU02_12776 [Colletotrichum truncatum]
MSTNLRYFGSSYASDSSTQRLKQQFEQKRHLDCNEIEKIVRQEMAIRFPCLSFQTKRTANIDYAILKWYLEEAKKAFWPKTSDSEQWRQRVRIATIRDILANAGIWPSSNSTKGGDAVLNKDVKPDGAGVSADKVENKESDDRTTAASIGSTQSIDDRNIPVQKPMALLEIVKEQRNDRGIPSTLWLSMTELDSAMKTRKEQEKRYEVATSTRAQKDYFEISPRQFTDASYATSCWQKELDMQRNQASGALEKATSQLDEQRKITISNYRRYGGVHPEALISKSRDSRPPNPSSTTQFGTTIDTKLERSTRFPDLPKRPASQLSLQEEAVARKPERQRPVSTETHPLGEGHLKVPDVNVKGRGSGFSVGNKNILDIAQSSQGLPNRVASLERCTEAQTPTKEYLKTIAKQAFSHQRLPIRRRPVPQSNHHPAAEPSQNQRNPAPSEFDSNSAYENLSTRLRNWHFSTAAGLKCVQEDLDNAAGHQSNLDTKGCAGPFELDAVDTAVNPEKSDEVVPADRDELDFRGQEEKLSVPIEVIMRTSPEKDGKQLVVDRDDDEAFCFEDVSKEIADDEARGEQVEDIWQEATLEGWEGEYVWL